MIKDCGPEQSAVNAHEHLFHNKAVTINDCSSVYLQNVIVNSSSNKGLLVINFIDRIVLSAMTSTGVAFFYNGTTAIFNSYLEIFKQRYSPFDSCAVTFCDHISLFVQSDLAKVIVNISDTTIMSYTFFACRISSIY